MVMVQRKSSGFESNVPKEKHAVKCLGDPQCDCAHLGACDTGFNCVNTRFWSHPWAQY